MTISKRELNAFLLRLNLEDRSPGTIGKYLYDAGGMPPRLPLGWDAAS